MSSPVRELHRTLRQSFPIAAEKGWYVTTLQWSRFISNSFYVGFGGASPGALGLFTLEPFGHPGCTIETDGWVASLDVHPNRPDLVCCVMDNGYSGVVLYQLQSGQLATTDLSTVNGREVLRQQFISAPNEFHFELVWKLDLLGCCISVLWRSTSEIIALTKDDLIRLTVPTEPAEPTKEVLTERDDDGTFWCIAVQNKPWLTTFHTGTHYPCVDQTPCDRYCKVALGTLKGVLKVFSLLPSFGSEFRIAKAHAKRIRAVDWNPADPEILVSGSEDKTVKLWKMDSGAPLLTIKFDEKVFVHGILWAPFSSTIFAVMLWDEGRSIFLFDLAVDRSKPVAVSCGVDGTRTRMAFHSYRPFLLTSFLGGERFRCLELRPNPMNQHQGEDDETSSTDELVLEEVRKLHQILGV